MKKKHLYLFILILVGASCKRSILDLNPITSTSVANFYKTSTDFLNAVNGVYAVLQSAGISTEYLFGDLPTDDTFSPPGRVISGDGFFDDFTVVPSGNAGTTVVANRWNNAYIGISRANTLLNRIDAVELNPALKNQYKGEALFLRAYFYFTLVKTFGNVPLITKEITSQSEAYIYPRVATTLIYQQIEQDLAESINLLPVTYLTADLGRVGKAAAQGYLARVLLFQRKFNEATPILSAIITDPARKFDLLPNYADVFTYNNGNNKEILFAIQYSGTVLGQTGSVTNTFLSGNQPTTDIYAAFTSGDGRRSAAIEGIGGTASRVKKFIDPTTGQLGGVDYPILRYADILLMYAECLNEGGDVNSALTYLNMVRQRAFGNATNNYQNTNPLATSTYVSGSLALQDLILLERRLEFCFEGLRFFDLLRTNKAETVLNAYFTKYAIKINGVTEQMHSFQRVFPVPQTIIDLSRKLYNQNADY